MTIIKTTGYALQSRIRKLKVDIDTYSTQFENGKSKFQDEDKVTSMEAFTLLQNAELQLAEVQTQQCMYNQAVFIDVQGQRMSLAKAIRLVGGAGRAEAMWRKIVAPKKDRYSMGDAAVRKEGKQYASLTYTNQKAHEMAVKTANYAAALRQAIQEANAQEVELDLSKI